MKLIAYLRFVHNKSEAGCTALYEKCCQFRPPEASGQDLQWIGYTSDPLFYGLELLTAQCVFEEKDVKEGEKYAELLLQSNVNLVECYIQEAQVVGVEQYVADAFSICKKLFHVQNNESLAHGHVKERLLSEEMFKTLEDQGYVVLECLQYCERIEQVVTEASHSLARRAENGVQPSMEGNSGPFCFLLDFFDALGEELDSRIKLRGERELQFSCFKGGGQSSGYLKHTDALPDDGSDQNSIQRRITAILYCNADWIPAHEGELKIWKRDFYGGGCELVAPSQGCVHHQVGFDFLFDIKMTCQKVMPTKADRLAATCWYR
eukprot:755774-Hanusia_phi.AAC.1